MIGVERRELCEVVCRAGRGYGGAEREKEYEATSRAGRKECEDAGRVGMGLVLNYNLCS